MSELEQAVDLYLDDVIRGQWSSINRNFPMEYWDVSRITDLAGLFSTSRNPAAVVFNGDVSRWNIGSATTLSAMFAQAYSFRGDLSRWNTARVQRINNMFHYATSFNSPLNAWDVSQVTEAGWAFRGAISFNQELGDWNLPNNAARIKMLAGAASFNQNLCAWSSADRGMLAGTSCPFQGDPDDGATFCQAC